MMAIYPKCATENDDNWPIAVNGLVAWYGCQSCWEKECDQKWWDAVVSLEGLELAFDVRDYACEGEI